ncbi:MAG: ATP-binding protein [Alphaproteobacteria bacterium]|nr:ATP-binding protein [Alphaproteobacteria bacterium]
MDQTEALARIAAALERLAPPPPGPADLSAGGAFVWRPRAGGLVPVQPAALDLDLLVGVDAQKAALLANTRSFAAGRPANNALLWGARGAGKSALVKAVHKVVAAETPALKIVEVGRDDLDSLPALLGALAGSGARVILFLDDLAFEGGSGLAKALRPALEGGLASRTDDLVVYATSNRRHLLDRDPRENVELELHWRDAAEERLALADRFGLWLGFHAMDQDVYLEIVRTLAAAEGLRDGPEMERAALEWCITRGSRSGRVARQFLLDWAARG